MATPFAMLFSCLCRSQKCLFSLFAVVSYKVCMFYKIVLSFSNITLVLISAKVIDKLLLRSISISKCKLIII